MIEKLFWFPIALSLLLFSGCVNHSIDSALPDRRPLGEEFEAYQPPTRTSSMATDVPPVVEPNAVITLRQAAAMALMHNPELGAFSWQVRAAEARQLQSSLTPNPELEVEVEEAAGSGGRSGFDGAETTILLSQLIELGDKRTRRTELAVVEKRLAGWDYEAKRMDVFAEVTKAFVDVLAEQERVELAQDLVKLSEQVLSTVKQRVEAGKDSPLEQTKGQVALAGAEIEFEKAKSSLESARKRLSATWAGKSPVFEKAAGRLDSTAPVPSLDELTRLIDQNPDVARWALEMEQRQAVLELAKANAIQDVRLGGGLQRFNETDDNAVVFGVAVPIPLFDRNQGKILEARHKLAQAAALSRAAETRIHTALAQAHARFSSAFNEATALRDKVLQGAQSAFDAATEGYRAGKLGFLDVLDARRTLFEARAKHIDALEIYHTARTEVERLIGQGIEASGAPWSER